MRNLDFTPLWRSTIGFERLFDLMDEALSQTGTDNYPPYDVERLSENHYRISFAVAGFKPEEITVTATQDLLTVEGRKTQATPQEYLHQGISARPFRRKFTLADYVQVTHARFENGLLKIELVRELPELMKPRRIEVRTSSQPNENKQIEHQKAA
jgi:molecular chaperone IbpA